MSHDTALSITVTSVMVKMALFVFYKVDVVFSRDLDSQFTERELAAVNDWTSQKKAFHIMRDHPHHGHLHILGTSADKN